MIRTYRPKLLTQIALFLLVAAAFLLYLTNEFRTIHQSPAPLPAAGEVSTLKQSRAQANLAEDKAIHSGSNPVHKARKAYVIRRDDITTSSATIFKSRKAGSKDNSNLVREKEVVSATIKDKSQAISDRDLLKNISRPYYKIVGDEGFNIDRTYFRLHTTRMSTVPDKFSITSTVCNSGSPQILFVIPSVVSHGDRKERTEIRWTWASSMYDSTWRQTSSSRLAFFFGSSGMTPSQLDSLREESEEYGDIVVGDFLDSYHNLSLKMAVTITWVARNCPQIKAAIKIDMDTYVNIELLLRLMAQLPVRTNPKFIFGHQHGATHPAVVRTGRWAVPESLYPFNQFPRYIYGHSYVISGPAVKLMADSFPYFPIVPNEDAFATGIVTVTLNITRFHHDAFAYLLEKRTLCNMTQGVHVTAVMKSENRRKLWNAFKTRRCLDIDL